MRVFAVLFLSACACSGCAQEKPVAAVPAAKVAGAVPEGTLTTLTLTAEAQRRLGIESVPIQSESVGRTRSLGGEVILAGGAIVTIAAPMTGTLGPETSPPVGRDVDAGESVLTLIPLAPAERDVRIEAERVVAEAVGRQEMTAKRAARARQLVEQGAGSVRASEEAQADLAVADAALKAAQDRLALAAKGVSAAGAIALRAPRRGLLRNLFVGPGQTVNAGAPLFDLVDLDPIWIRVPVFAGERDTLETDAGAEVVPVGSVVASAGVVAMPIQAPPSADVATAGVDVFYRLANPDHALRPGQRVTVRIPLRARQQGLVVPRAALLFDAFGGTWVYEDKGGGTFVRHRVAVADMVEQHAIVSAGPPAGTRVVTVGAAELFGTEFGAGK